MLTNAIWAATNFSGAQDGKIYVIFNTPSAVTPAALNLVALAPEDGHLVWNYYDRYMTGATSGKQLAFNSATGHVYFQSSSLTYSSGGLYAHRLDNGQRDYAISGGSGHTIVAPDQTAHNSMQSFTPQLALNWTLPLFGQGPTQLQDVGADSVHYITQNYYRLYAVNPDGTEKWHFDDCASGTNCRTLNDPIVSPANQVVFVLGTNSPVQTGYCPCAGEPGGQRTCPCPYNYDSAFRSNENRSSI